MDIATKKYVRKPLVVEAIQVTSQNFEEVAKWCQGEIVSNNGTEAPEKINPGDQHIRVRVHNPLKPRQTQAYVGDWILYTEKGYKIYTPKAFTSSFTEMNGTGPIAAVES